MKHFTQTTANGLCTPPCGSSRSKSTRFSLLTSFLLFFLLFVGSNAAWAESVTYNGTEFFYWNSHQYIGNDEWGSIYATSVTDRKMWLKFTNSSNSNVGYSGASVSNRPAHYWVGDGQESSPYGILGAVVPAGTWTHVTILRCWGDQTQVGETGRTYELQSGKDYLNENQNMAVFSGTPKFYLPGNTNLVGSNWQYNGNGTVYTGYAELELEAGNDYRFKLMPYKATSWDFCEANYNQFDQTNSNITCTNPGDNQIKFSLDEAATVRIAFDGQKITVNTVSGGGDDPEPAEREISTDYRLRGDLWVYDNSGNWAGKNNNPELTLKSYREIDGTYTFSYIAPVANKNRFTVMIGGGSDINASKADGSSSDVTEDGVKYKFNVSTPKQVDITYYPSTTKAKVVLSDYTPITSGWYFKCESAIGGVAANTNTAMAADGTLLLENVAEGTYNFYIHNNASELYWGQNKFGGCYVDQTNSTASLISSKIADKKFDGKQWPIMRVSDRKVQMVVSGSDIGKNVRVSFDGGKIVLTLQDPPTPAVTYTVTLHPNNGGDNIVRTSVPENSTASAAALNLSAVTYGNGTATWYTNAECTTPFTSVTEDMDLYAKWGVSGNFYLVGDFGMHDKGSNWAYNSGLAMTTTDGVASVTYIAPKGRHRFEILTSRSSWPAIANQGSGLIAASTPTLSWSNEGAGGNYHFRFDLDAPKKVTVRYDGKVSVTAEDYVVAKTGWTVASKSLFGHGAEESPDNADNGAYMNGYNMTEGQMNSDGELVIHNLNAGTYKFWIGKYNTALNKQKQNIEVFGAAHVDKANSSLGDYGSLANVSDDTYNRSIPMDDKLHRRVQFTLTQTASIKIAFDGGKITVNLLPKYTVTFNSNDGSAVASQSVFEGTTASEPTAPTKAGYEFVKWQLSGADYDFSSAVTGNITLDAVWAYKAVSSVALNESEHTTWVGNSNFVLTLTKNPSDLITKSVVWSSDNTSAASVSDGTVHAEGVGTATITCTVTDMFDHVESASCEVSVAACEMTTDNLYSMTVTGYNSSTGSSATLNGLWNESSDNTEPATFRIVKLRFQPNSNYISNQNPYAADVNGVLTGIAATNDGSDQWYEIPAGSGNYNTTLYYLKNVKTNRYIVRGSTFHNTGNGEWYYYNVYTEAENPENGNSKWFYDTSTGNTRLICYQGYAGTVAATANDQSGNGAFMIHNGNWNAPGVAPNCAPPALMCGFVTSGNFSNAYTTVRGVEVVDASYANPNYTLSLMNSSYYRMKENATVQANLANGLAYGSVITVRLYADAATSVKLQTAAGDDVETINLSADAAREYTYTVAYGSELVGETAFVIKAADNHAGIASIEVSRMHAASPSSPALTWDLDLSSGVTQSALAGTFQHVASSALSSGAVHYVSSNPAVATVAADGTVTPIMAGNTTITATIEQRECYAEASIAYGITLTEPTLAELIAADAGAGITLTHDYAENIVIDKAVTINGGGHSIGNLKVENEGDLTLSSALTVADFTICAKAGNTTTPAASGQVRNASNLTVDGEAYFLYTVDPSGHVQYGWYDFTVPFPVNVMTGIKGIQEGVLKENFVNETDYAIMEHLGDKQAAGQYAYKKFRGIMQPCRLYSITLDNDYNYNTIRFQKTNDGALVAGNSVTLNSYPAGEAKHANWNGVGNGTLHHADAEVSTVGYIQVYQSGTKTFLPVDKNEYSLVIGSAFMVQQAGTMTLNQATHDNLLAPKREESHQLSAISIQIAREGKPFSDQLFISADETAGQGYNQGVDVAKAGNIGNVNVPQIWTNAYNSKLCAHEAQLINGEAQYALSLYAPANGSYTLTSTSIPAGTTLYLTQNDHIIWDMSENYTFDLNKGTTTEYGLLLVQSHKIPTGIENSEWTNNEGRKVLHNGILYILHNGKVFNAQGAVMK